ncbi:MAG: DNA translocase FtsK 4TM domain-containing protein [Brevinema sp.]
MFKGIMRVVIAYTFILFFVLLSISLIGFSFSDLMFYTTNFHVAPSNWLGIFGLKFAMPFAVFYGHASMIWAIYSFVTGMNILFGITPNELLKQFGVVHLLGILSATTLSLFTKDSLFINGGMIGSLFASKMLQLFPNIIWVPVLLGLFLLTLSTVTNIPQKIILGIYHIFRAKKSLCETPSIAGEDTSNAHPIESNTDLHDSPSEFSSPHLNVTIPVSENNSDANLFASQEDYLYIKDKPQTVPVPEFLRQSVQNDDWNQEPLFLTKKRLSQTVEPPFLREVDIDLLSPYYQTNSSFYHKIYEAQRVDEDLTELDDIDYANPNLLSSQDRLDQSAVTDHSHAIKRLSFARDVVDSVEKMETTEDILTEEKIELDNQNFNTSPIDDKVVMPAKENISEHSIQDDENQQTEEPLKETESNNIEAESEEITDSQHDSKFPPVLELERNTNIILPDITDDVSLADIKNQTEPLFIDQAGLSSAELMLLEGVERTQERKKNTQDIVRQKLKAKQEQLAEEYHKKFPTVQYDIGDLTKELDQLGVDKQVVPTPEECVKEIDVPKTLNIDDEFAVKYLEDEISELKKAPDAVDREMSDPPNNPFEDILAKEEPPVSPEESEKLQKELMIFTDNNSSKSSTPSRDTPTTLDHQSESDLNQQSFITDILGSEGIKQENNSKDDFIPLTNLELPVPLYDFEEEENKILTDYDSDEIIVPQSLKKQEDDSEIDHTTESIDLFDQDDDLPKDEDNNKIDLEVPKELSSDTVSLDSQELQNFVHDLSDHQEMLESTYQEIAEIVDLVSEDVIFVDNEKISTVLDQNDLVNAGFIDPSVEQIHINNPEEPSITKIQPLQEETIEDDEDDLDALFFTADHEDEHSNKDMEQHQNQSSELLEPHISHISNLEDEEAALLPKLNTKSHLIDNVEYVDPDDSDHLNISDTSTTNQELSPLDQHTSEIVSSDDIPSSDLQEELDSSNASDIQHKEIEQSIHDTEHIEDTTEYHFPRVEELVPNTDVISAEQETLEIEETMKMIEDTYESFNINMQVIDYSRGPTITRFEMEPPSGLKLRTILNLQDDLALQAGTSNIRIISPVEGRSCIGIEVPNKIRRQFLLRQQIESVTFQESKADLPLILGVDVAGKEIVGDLATTPHLLIAGTTGSGKSVYVNALIIGLLYKLSPKDLRFIMIDPKMVELEPYRGIPHLLSPIITKPEEAMVALTWAVEEMDRRYKLLSELGVRNIKEYKALAKNAVVDTYEKLPYVVIIVDEFANLMLRAPKDTEKNISRLASMSRAVGMHLVLATQRPSVDVVTGVIKANFPSRIAFRVSSKIDARTILDKNGAETLLGRGDMLFMSPDFMDTIRIQSPFVSGEDVARVVNEIKKNGEPNYLVNFSDLLEKSEEKNSSDTSTLTDALNDPLFEEVLRYAVDNGEISASGIQRRFRVGYNRASRLIETMKDMKIISPPPSAGKGWIINITHAEIKDYLE